MKNLFYYRFKKEDGKIAIGQAKFTELVVPIQNIYVCKDGCVKGFENPFSAKLMFAPTKSIVDFTDFNEPLFATFEDAVNDKNSIRGSRRSIRCDDVEKNPFELITDEILDSIDGFVNVEFSPTYCNTWYMKCFAYKWNGVKPVKTTIKELAYDFIHDTSVITDENFSFDGFYLFEETCQEENAVECYTF